MDIFFDTALVLDTALVGMGATLATDVWALVRRRLLGVALPNWGLVGRWIGHMPRGRFRHRAMASATPVPGETAIGWVAHYAIGVAFAAALPILLGPTWLRQPTLLPALGVGVITVLAPFLLMQPGMGAGLFACRVPRPGAARLQSLATHVVFGLGLHASALALSCLGAR